MGMGWEQRFGALIELAGDEWDAAPKRLEQEWLAAYTAAFVETAVSRGWRRGMPRRGRSGLATRHSLKPIATTGTPGGRLRTLSLAKSHPDCQTTFPMAANPPKSRPNIIDMALSDEPSHGVKDAKRTPRRHKGMIAGYARTSTSDQAAGLAAQERDLREYPRVSPIATDRDQ
jgi:hypothetical protein